ncbi:hypothetical protein XENOCAPTIV_016146 [Xenoophorus captivus]|uniref:Uncharacterized protein n=1 Tax=Xenoophorus captivus TaxID=1517983 RepID=A0ABV0SFL4_9TELE
MYQNIISQVGHRDQMKQKRFHCRHFRKKRYTCTQCGKPSEPQVDFRSMTVCTVEGNHLYAINAVKISGLSCPFILTVRRTLLLGPMQEELVSPFQLKVHQQTHSGERPLNSDLGGKTFYRQNRFKSAPSDSHRRPYVNLPPMWQSFQQ